MPGSLGRDHPRRRRRAVGRPRRSGSRSRGRTAACRPWRCRREISHPRLRGGAHRGASIMTRSPRQAASTVGSTSRPCRAPWRPRRSPRAGRRPRRRRSLQVEGVGVALGAVADDRDGLAVEQREVSVVVVEHGAQAIRPVVRGPQRQGRPPRATCRRATLGRQRARTCDRVERAVGSGVRRESLGEAAWISAISASGRSSTASWSGARVEHRVPELLEARVATVQLERSTRTSVKPACSSSSRTRSGPPSTKGPGGPEGAARPGRALAAPRRGASSRGCVELVPHCQRDAPSGRSTRRVSGSAADGSAISM